VVELVNPQGAPLARVGQRCIVPRRHAPRRALRDGLPGCSPLSDGVEVEIRGRSSGFSSSRRASRDRRTTPFSGTTSSVRLGATLRALERFGPSRLSPWQTDRPLTVSQSGHLLCPKSGFGSCQPIWSPSQLVCRVPTSAAGARFRGTSSLLRGLRESDGNRLLATLHLAAFSRPCRSARCRRFRRRIARSTSLLAPALYLRRPDFFAAM